MAARFNEVQVQHCQTAFRNPWARGSGNKTISWNLLELSTDKVEHFISFINSPHIIQDLLFGERIIKLSTKEIIKVPNVIRVVVPERIVRQYQAYCQASDFNPMSRSTLLRVLVCVWPL